MATTRPAPSLSGTTARPRGTARMILRQPKVAIVRLRALRLALTGEARYRCLRHKDQGVNRSGATVSTAGAASARLARRTTAFEIGYGLLKRGAEGPALDRGWGGSRAQLRTSTCQAKADGRIGEPAVAVKLLDLRRMQPQTPGRGVLGKATRISDAKLVSQMTRDAHRDGRRLIQTRAEEANSAELDGKPKPHVIPTLGAG